MKRRPWIVVLWGAITLGLPVLSEATAAAQGVTVREAGMVVRGSVRRARRAIAIGPSVGGAFAMAPVPGESAGSIHFGLSLYTFKIPILPDAEMIKDVIMQTVKERLKERIKEAVLAGKPPTPEEEKDWGEEIVEKVKAEVMGTASFRSKTFERPSAALTLEADYNLSGEVWSLRTRGGIGVNRLLLGLTFGTHFADDTIYSMGGEIALLALPGKGPRSPVFDMFVRAEFPLNTATDGYSFGLGIRLLVDII